jgi:hypothetical protein
MGYRGLPFQVWDDAFEQEESHLTEEEGAGSWRWWDAAVWFLRTPD